MVGAILLALAGLVAGMYGTIVGAGGGFLFVPLLLLTRPDLTPASITTISLGAVFFNGISGTIAYARQKRIDYKTSLLFAAATVPTASVGALVVSQIPKAPFQLTFGALLIFVGIFIFFRKASTSGQAATGWGAFSRKLTDGKGNNYEWSYNLPSGLIVSVFVGFLASLLGVGGGILLVPVMVTFFAFPPLVATATSTLTLVFTSLSATATHVAHQDFNGIVQATVLAALGMVIGAQFGARLSQRMSGRLIVRLLAVALAFVGLRLIQGILHP